MRPVKIVSSLLLLSLLGLTGCNTHNTRRDMYWPKRGSGYWTERSRHGKAAAEAAETRTKPPALDATAKAPGTPTP
jgi:hypothetical protein